MPPETNIPNIALGHVTDAIGDLDAFKDDQIDDRGRVAAKHADVLLRDAMNEVVSAGDLLDIACWCVELATDGRDGAIGSAIWPSRPGPLRIADLPAMLYDVSQLR